MLYNVTFWYDCPYIYVKPFGGFCRRRPLSVVTYYVAGLLYRWMVLIFCLF